MWALGFQLLGFSKVFRRIEIPEHLRANPAGADFFLFDVLRARQLNRILHLTPAKLKTAFANAVEGAATREAGSLNNAADAGHGHLRSRP